MEVLRPDNGGEYLSDAFQSHLATHGIYHEPTVPRTARQNGMAERFNRIVMYLVFSILLDHGTA